MFSNRKFDRVAISLASAVSLLGYLELPDADLGGRSAMVALSDFVGVRSQRSCVSLFSVDRLRINRRRESSPSASRKSLS